MQSALLLSCSPLRPGSLDFAFMVTILEFLEDPRRALMSVKEVLRPDGCLVVMVLNRESPWASFRGGWLRRASRS